MNLVSTLEEEDNLRNENCENNLILHFFIPSESS